MPDPTNQAGRDTMPAAFDVAAFVDDFLNEPIFTDSTVVLFEGEEVRWGELMVQDRKAYLNGGYPF